MQYQFQDIQLGHWIKKFFFWFAPAVYHDNPTKERRANFLNIILPATFLATLVIFFAEVIGGKTFSFDVGLNILLAITLLFLGYGIHKGNVESSGLAFLIVVFVRTSMALIGFGTVLSPVLVSYPLIVIGAGILFNRKGIVIATILSLLALFGLIVIETSGLAKSQNDALAIPQWSIYIALFIVTISVIFWAFPKVWQALVHVERQMAELEASPIPMIITDCEGQIEYVNSKYTQVMGYTLNEVKMTKLLFRQLERLQPQNYSQLWPTLLNGQAWHSELQTQTKNGEWFFASYSITPLTDSTGQITQFIITIKDISERKRVEAERMALNRTREFATLYEITHDLGTFSNMSTLLESILPRVTSLLNISAGAIYLLDSERLEFDLVSEMGMPLQLGSPVSYDKWLLINPPRIHTDASCLVRIPIVYANECLGMLILDMSRSSGGMPIKPNMNLLVLLATQIASAIHNIYMFDRVRVSRARTQTLAKEILSTQEKERRLIARELHDEFGQELTSVQLGLQDISRLVKQSNTQAKLSDVMGTIEQVLEQMRNLSRGLRPSVLDDFGLVAALEWFVEQQVKFAGLETEIIADELEVRLPEEVETVCFRVAQEAITNVLRHGRATRVVIEIRLRDEKLELMIHDNGVGFDLPDAMKNVTKGNSLGLLNMHERVELIGGQLQIITAPGQGTRIRAQIPLKSSIPIMERRLLERISN